MSNPKPLLFLHIPKTAGTSVIESLGRVFNREDFVRLTQRHTFRTDMNDAVRANRKFICGHVPLSIAEDLLPEVLGFTVLRDPVARVLSLYKFWRSFESGTFAGSEQEVSIAHAHRMTVSEFASSRHPLVRDEVSNGMCRMLLPNDVASLRFLSDLELYEAARRSLDKLVFGTTEELDKTLDLLQMQLGAPLDRGVKLNVFASQDTLPISTQEVRAIAETNKADQLLFAYASSVLRVRHENFVVDSQLKLSGKSSLTSLLPIGDGTFRWTADQRLCGFNWHERESWSDGTVYRFSSGDVESTVYFECPFRGAGSIEIHVLFFAQDQFCEPMESIRLRIEDIDILTTITLNPGGGAVIRGQLPGEVRAVGRIKVGLSSDYGFTPKVCAGVETVDQRSLFAAVTRIDLSST